MTILIYVRSFYRPDSNRSQACAWTGAAKSQLALIVADATSIEIEETEGVQLIDCGGNLEKISCPNCSQELDLDWWQDRMDEDFSGEGFSLNRDLVPCCQAELSLSDLHYQWPMGFARFSITVINPGRLDRLPKVIAETPHKKLVLPENWIHL